jgi:hypothetical protein
MQCSTIRVLEKEGIHKKNRQERRLVKGCRVLLVGDGWEEGRNTHFTQTTIFLCLNDAHEILSVIVLTRHNVRYAQVCQHNSRNRKNLSTAKKKKKGKNNQTKVSISKRANVA